MIGTPQFHTTSVIIGLSSFILSLIFTVITSAIELTTNFTQKLIYFLRFLCFFICLTLYFSIICTIKENFLAGEIILCCSFFSFFVYIAIISFSSYKEKNYPIFSIRVFSVVIGLICLILMLLPQKFGSKFPEVQAISSYIVSIFSIILIFTLFKELSTIFIDVVIITKH